MSIRAPDRPWPGQAACIARKVSTVRRASDTAILSGIRGSPPSARASVAASDRPRGARARAWSVPVFWGSALAWRSSIKRSMSAS